MREIIYFERSRNKNRLSLSSGLHRVKSIYIKLNLSASCLIKLIEYRKTLCLLNEFKLVDKVAIFRWLIRQGTFEEACFRWNNLSRTLPHTGWCKLNEWAVSRVWRLPYGMPASHCIYHELYQLLNYYIKFDLDNCIIYEIRQRELTLGAVSDD